MNIWGIDNFSNEAAADWLYDFGENDFRLIDRTLAGIANLLPIDDLDAEEAAEALVAAECVAAALGAKATAVPDELHEWLANNPAMHVKPDYVDMAQKSVARVLEKSELRDYWEKTSQFEAWQAIVEGLQKRLQTQ